MLMTLRPDQMNLLLTLNIPECRMKGCHLPGIYFMRRLIQQTIQMGFYCDGHEHKFGRENLRRCAGQTNATLGIIVDTEGSFEGIVPKKV